MTKGVHTQGAKTDRNHDFTKQSFLFFLVNVLTKCKNKTFSNYKNL